MPGSLDAGGIHAASFSFDDDSGAPYTNKFGHVLVRDLASGEVSRVGSLTNLSRESVLSADGRYVAYFSSEKPSAALGVTGTIY